MISLSRLIKSQWTNSDQSEQKIISIKMFDHAIAGDPQAIEKLQFEKNSLLENARKQAEMMMQEATVHAQSIREQAQEEMQNWANEKAMLAEQAQIEGYDRGLQEGRELGYKEIDELIAFSRGIVESSKEEYRKQIEKSESTILDLAVKVAGKIIGGKLEGNPEEFLDIVKRALKEARDYREIQLHINPLHYQFLLSQKDELVALFPKETDLYIYPDENLSEKDCIIESANGRIDASVDSQLEEIKRKLLELLESE
ncbi:MAG: flagellar assembly protein FliH [Bacillota bacterium]|nr:flagellar assembly protein FliH [Bacillota bacterium]MDP4169543.1 flagellar assembly protein FliH [Bacillota bacterium]